MVSTDETGALLSGAALGELDMSADGSRVLIGKGLNTDSKGNTYWHPYMHIGTSAESLDLAPTASSGLLFDGMTADGSRVFFTTVDNLLPAEDTDESADIYEFTVHGNGTVDTRLVSIDGSGPSNDDGCSPAGSPNSWNSPEGEGKCSAIAFAGGAGVASEAGSFYFLSPEQLDGTEGQADQPNLYSVVPGGKPVFVATLDTSEGKPGLPHWTNTLSDGDFTNGSLSEPRSMTVDQETGDLYVVEAGTGALSRFDSSGAPKTFPETGTNKISGLNLTSAEPGQVAIDNSASGPMKGDIYVSHNPGAMNVYDKQGKKIGELNAAPTFGIPFAQVCGIAVDQTNGDVYVTDLGPFGPGFNFMYRFHPITGTDTTTVDSTDYEASVTVFEGSEPCRMAADNGIVYAADNPSGPTKAYDSSEFAFGVLPGKVVDSGGEGVSIDSVAHELYVDAGKRISVYGTGAGFPKVNEIADESLSGSRGVAVDSGSHDVYATAGTHVQRYGYVPPEYHPVDHPAVLHAVVSATHRFGDFQVTPDGRFAAFSSKMPLAAGYDNAGFSEVYRYDNVGHSLACVSCVPTDGQPSTSSGLPEYGSGLTDDGRVFFDTGEQLVLKDTNQNRDAYEWENGVQQLISSGTSIFDSGMLGVTGSGKDAFFFTREQLVEDDLNGEAMKIYDAREQGGFFKLPKAPDCAASDECHGPGSQAASAPQLGTFKGGGGQFQAPSKCRKGHVKRHGKCVKKKHKKHKKHKKGNSRRTGPSGKGGSK